ncbi:MAG: dTDP-glucose 4,6-dehydratase [Taibaiella sp.]|nr:dTDP-glucose 4,6-dehydratase [Taibaiella sp.]
MKKIVITGGAGFIGSHVVRLFVEKYPQYQIYNLDKLTYAGNLENLKDIETSLNYHFIKLDITDQQALSEFFSDVKPTDVIHLAAESHVDRSISSPEEFAMTNVMGTIHLLNYCKEIWRGAYGEHVFYQISTDEVYGTLGEKGLFTEGTAYDPHSPYSASKAAADHFVRAYGDTYGMQVKVSNCSNNYGSHQFPEKLIPLAINNIRNSRPIPVYGKGENVRDWLWVEDHTRAIDIIFHKAGPGTTYNVGGSDEWKNIDLIRILCDIMDRKLDRPEGSSRQLITYIKDRAGHDLRYAIDSSKLKKDLGWGPSLRLEEGLEKTVDWYLGNDAWMNNVTSGVYQDYYKFQYQK